MANIVGALLAKKFLPKKFRFFKRIKLVPGVTLNISHAGHSFSVGPHHLKKTWTKTNTKSGHVVKKTRTTFGIPHTGIYRTTTHVKKTKLNKP